MPKRTDIKKVMVIGSGPIVIGQAAEFDYAGTQACLALKEEGYEVILVNSNPATIMTDTHIADKVYMEPLTLEYVAKIIRYERPDAIVPGLGGQTGLNLAVQLAKKGVLQECQVEILGTSFESIEQAEDRELFKELCERLGEPVLPSHIANNMEEGIAAAERIGYPVVLRPAFTLGGTGGGFADNREELEELMRNALILSPVHQVLVEKSIKGYKEIEYEVMRDANDTAISICCMENIDPVGIHTGDSIVVAPCQTLTNREFQMLRDSALKIIRALKIEGGCNVQFALDPLSFKYYLIEVNPRVSRSSALASKASGYPIARVTAKVAMGLTLDEIRLANTPASFEPALDYVVTKVARFPFDKFSDASNKLGTQMKATGEVMSVGRTMEESLLKAVRSLETGVCHIYHKKFDTMSDDEMLTYIKEGTDDRLYAIAQLIRNGVDLALIYNNTKIDMFFLEKFKNIVEMERTVAAHPFDEATLREAKRMGFGDKYIGMLWGATEHEMYALREKLGIFPVYKMIDTCASEFSSYVPYFYSTYEQENESLVSDREKIIVLGSGPIRIGQGVEFDYSTVHAIWSIRKAGYEAIIINNNPETVSTDYTCSDKLYFEPLTVEDVMNVIHLEKPKSIVVSLGGQTAINLAGAAGAAGRADHRHRRAGDPQRRGPRLLREDHGAAGHPAAAGRGRDRHRGGRGGRYAHRLSGAGASELRAGRPRHADRLERGAPAPLPADGRRGQRGFAGAGRPLYHGQGAGGGRHLRRQGGLHPRHHGACRAYGYPLGRLDQRLSDLQREPEGQGQDHRLYGQAGPSDRYRRPVQHPVHRRRRGRRLRHRGQPALVAHRALPLEVHGRADGPHRHAGDSGQVAPRAGHHGGLRS